MPHKNKDTSNESISDMQNCLNHEERSIDTITFPYEENERLVSYDKNRFMAIKSGEKEGDYMDNEENKEINTENEKRDGECDSKGETIGCNENGDQNGKNCGNGLCNENVGCNKNNDKNGKNYENGKNNENMGCRSDAENQVNGVKCKMMYNECEQENAQNVRIARTENNRNNENARSERCSPKREIKMEDERKYSLKGENKENNGNVKYNELRETGEYKCGDENEKIEFNSNVREMNLQFTDGETESHNNHASYNYRRTEPTNERDYNLNTNNASNGTEQREVNELESPNPIYSKNIEDTRMTSEPFDTENALASQKIVNKRSYRQMHPSYGNDLQYNNFYNPTNYGYNHADEQELRRGREYTRMPYTYNDSHNYSFTNGYYGDFGRDGKYSMSENESYNYRNSFGSVQSTRSFSPFETKDYNDYNESKMSNGIFDKSYIEGRNFDNYNDTKITDKTVIEGRNLDKSYNESLKDNYNDSKATIESKAYNDTISTRNESLLFNLPHASEKESCKNFDGTYAILRDNQFINCQSNIQHLKKRKSKTEPFEKNVKRMYVKGSRKRPERQSFEDKAFPNKEYTFDYLNYDQKKVKFVNEYDKYNYESQNVMQSRPFPESIPEYDNMYHDDTGYCDTSLQNNSVYTMPIHAQSKAFNSSQDHGDMSYEFDNVNNDCKQETDYVSSPSEYIYNCDPCMKKFKRLSTLKIHIFSHIKDAKIFKCPKTNCDSGFKSQAIAIKHIQHFHREERTMLIELLKRSKYITIFRSYTALIDYHRMLKLPNPFLETFCFGCFSYPRSMADHPCTRMFYNLQQCPSCKMDIESGKLDEHVYSEQCMRPGILTKEFENR